MTPERQVLYALVGVGFLVVVAVLVVAAAAVGLVPVWWTVVSATAWFLVVAAVALDWRATARVLGSTILLFLAWTVGTLVVQ